MFRWLLATFLILMLVNALTPWFRRMGFGRLPGDLNFTLFGREFSFPLATTVILVLAGSLLARFLK